MTASGEMAGSDKIRLDKWLWHARFIKTRSLATRFCATGQVRIDGTVTEKPASTIRPGQVLTFGLGRHIRVIEVLSIGIRRGPPAEAQKLYCDRAPPRPETALPKDIPF